MSKNNNPLEKTIESRIRDYAREKGVMCFKLSSPQHNAVPDRMFILPTGRVFMMELKRKGKQPTIPQMREHARLKQYNVSVFVVDTIEMGKQIIDEMLFRESICAS